MRNTWNLLLMGLVLFSSSSFAGIFNFYLQGFPRETKTCLEQGSLAAELFQKNTGHSVVHVECIKETPTGYDFRWEYEAEKAIKVTTTDYSAMETTPAGRYREFSYCVSALPEQVEIFTEATRVTPLFAYCRKQNVDFGKNWEIVIVGIGETPMKPQLGGYLWFSEPQSIELPELKQSLSEKLKSFGGFLGDIIVHYNTVMGAGTTAIHYYAPQRIEFSLERAIQVPSLSQCSQSLKEVKEFLSSEEKGLFTSYCGKSTLGYFDLHLGFVGKPVTRMQAAAKSFSTLSDCESHKAAIVKEHSGSKLAKVLGGLCSKDTESGSYQVILFKKPA